MALVSVGAFVTVFDLGSGQASVAGFQRGDPRHDSLYIAFEGVGDTLQHNDPFAEICCKGFKIAQPSMRIIRRNTQRDEARGQILDRVWFAIPSHSKRAGIQLVCKTSHWIPRRYYTVYIIQCSQLVLGYVLACIFLWCSPPWLAQNRLPGGWRRALNNSARSLTRRFLE